MTPEAVALLARITRAIEALSEQAHRVQREKQAYQRAATELRMGRNPTTVMALLGEALGLEAERIGADE